MNELGSRVQGPARELHRTSARKKAAVCRVAICKSCYTQRRKNRYRYPLNQRQSRSQTANTGRLRNLSSLVALTQRSIDQRQKRKKKIRKVGGSRDVTREKYMPPPPGGRSLSLQTQKETKAPTKRLVRTTNTYSTLRRPCVNKLQKQQQPSKKLCRMGLNEIKKRLLCQKHQKGKPSVNSPSGIFVVERRKSAI